MASHATTIVQNLNFVLPTDWIDSLLSSKAIPSATMLAPVSTCKVRRVPEVESIISREAFEVLEAADRTREERIERLKKIIPMLADGSPEKAEPLFQLSQLYWAKARYLSWAEVANFQLDQRRADEARKSGGHVVAPSYDPRQSQLYRGEVIYIHELLLSGYPAFERRAELLFRLAENLLDLCHVRRASDLCEQLTERYPDCEFIESAREICRRARTLLGKAEQ